jgi:hypothetical protein
MERDTETLLTLIVVVVVFLSAFYTYQFFSPKEKDDVLVGTWYCANIQEYDMNGKYSETNYKEGTNPILKIVEVDDGMFNGTYKGGLVCGVKYNGNVFGFSGSYDEYTVQCTGSVSSGDSDIMYLSVTRYVDGVEGVNTFGVSYVACTRDIAKVPVVNSTQVSGASVGVTANVPLAGKLVGDWVLANETISGTMLSRYMFGTGNVEYDTKTVSGWKFKDIRCGDPSTTSDDSTSNVFIGTVSWSYKNSEGTTITEEQKIEGSLFSIGTDFNYGMIINQFHNISHGYLKETGSMVIFKDSNCGVFAPLTGADILAARYTFVREGQTVPADYKEEFKPGVSSSQIIGREYVVSNFKLLYNDGNTADGSHFTLRVNSVSDDKILWCAVANLPDSKNREDITLKITGFCTVYSSGDNAGEMNSISCAVHLHYTDTSTGKDVDQYGYVWIIPNGDYSTLTIRGMGQTNDQWCAATLTLQLKTP